MKNERECSTTVQFPVFELQPTADKHCKEIKGEVPTPTAAGVVCAGFHLGIVKREKKGVRNRMEAN